MRNQLKRIITLIIALLLIVSCSDDIGILSPENQVEYRELAYKILSDREKESLTINWQKGRVEEGKYKKKNDHDTFETSSGSNLFFISKIGNEYLYDGYKLIAISFNTKDDALLGPIIVIIDPYLRMVIGRVGRM